ncbi:MAG: hypothetical protein AB7S86_10720 [Hydrogenophaga sp.]|uniref:hypothetical protein n=1 Tax=Hydrogenophaga sp. TaxID=1904254 RepID=UPI003D10B324
MRPAFSWRAAATLLLLSMLAACAGPQIFQGQLSSLDKGLSTLEVETRLTQAPLARHRVELGARVFEIHAYRLNNGLQIDPYYLAYEQQRLVYWGYLNEFRRQPDRDLSQAVGQAQAPLQAAIKK